jgi:hypothetical protein
MARTPRSLDEVTRNIEQALIPPGEGAASSEGSTGGSLFGGEEPAESQPPASEAARPLSELYNKAADEIQKTGESVVQVANDIAAETRALADLLRKHGASIAGRIEEFSAMSKRVAQAVQKGRGEVSGEAATDTPIAPRP